MKRCRSALVATVNGSLAAVRGGLETRGRAAIGVAVVAASGSGTGVASETGASKSKPSSRSSALHSLKNLTF